MAVNILVVDVFTEPAMKLLDKIAFSDANITFIEKTVQAVKNVRRNHYDLVILGDKLDKGDTYDVGLEIKSGNKNNQTPVACVGKHKGRASRLVNLLRPYAVKVEPGNINNVANTLKTNIQSLVDKTDTEVSHS